MCMLPAALWQLRWHANLARLVSCTDTSNPALTYVDTTYVK
jgi:hypothetical protein